MTKKSKLVSFLLFILTLLCIYQSTVIYSLKSNVSSSSMISDAELKQHLNTRLKLALNVVDEDVLSPKLLDDQAEISQYLDAFREDQYEVKQVDGVGKFYLDDEQDFIKAFLWKGQVWEEHVVNKIIQHIRPGSTVIDAGAHIGTHTLVMSTFTGPYGRVYAFEPQKKIYRELYYNLKLNGADNVVPLRYAVGDENSIIEMSVVNEGNEGGTPVGSGGDKAELRTIDSFGFLDVSLMKIDVEHMEDQVLDGAKKTIMMNRPVLLVEIQGGYRIETAPEHIKAKIKTTITKILNMGYRVERFAGYDYIAIPAECCD
jgi:FkbM family methyltransferase